MNLINTPKMMAERMIVAVFFCSVVCHSADAYQVNIYTTGSKIIGVGGSDLHLFDESGPQNARLDINNETSGAGGIATDNTSLFVSERAGGLINRYDLQGNFLGEFADVSALADVTPSGGQNIETDGAGNIYTVFSDRGADSRSGFRLNPAGTISGTFSHPSLLFPSGIDANANGDVFILNSAPSAVGVGDRLFQFDAAGAYLNDFALPGISDALEAIPNDIAFNELTNELFVSDEALRSIFIYDLSNGAPVLTDTLPVFGRSIDVFVEQTSGRIFGTSVELGSDAQGFFLSGQGFEVSRDGSLFTNYTENALPRDQTVLGIVAIGVPEPSPLLGDVNLSGSVDFLDIAPFIAVLTSGTYQREADMNSDEMVNFLDIAPFIVALTGQ